MEPLGAPVLQAQPEQVAGVELEVLARSRRPPARESGLSRRAGAISDRRAAALEPGVLELARRADRAGPHAVQVLQVGAHVGEAVLERLDALDALHAGEPRGRARADVRARATR